jgi:hypothetical protein
MHYNSITEYFSRLQNRTLIIFFSGILLFMLVFYLMMIKVIDPVMSLENEGIILYALVAMAFIEASMVAILTRMMLAKSIGKVSLGERMDDYVKVNLIRAAMLLSGSLMLTLTVYLFNWEWLLMIYCIYLLFFLLFWPSRQRLCTDLKLKPSERDVINGL